MALSEFEAACHAVLERVARTGESIRITRDGEPVAEIVPPVAEKPAWLGAMADRTEILGDIVSPTFNDDEINAFNGRLL